MPAKSPCNPALNRGPFTTWWDMAKVSRPPPENLHRQARLTYEHAGAVQVLPGVRKLFPTAP